MTKLASTIFRIQHTRYIARVLMSLMAFATSCFILNHQLASGQQSWGNLQGQIVVEGQVSKPSKLETANTPYCEKHDLRDESLVVGADGGLKNVFIYLYQSGRNEKQPPVHPDAKAPFESPVLDNLNCRFEPHTFLLKSDQSLMVKNSDEIGHNAYFESRYNTKNQTIPAGQDVEVELTKAERAPFKISCGSHGWMSSYVLIRDDPYMAISGEDGKFEIKNLPAGEWTFRFWHERCGYMRQLQAPDDKEVSRQGEIKITIEPDKTVDLGKLLIKADALQD